MKLSSILTFLSIYIMLFFDEVVDMPILWESLLVGLSTGLIVYLINKNRYFEKKISFNVGCSILIIIPTIIFLFMMGSSQTTVNIEDLSYEEVINHSYSNQSPKIKVNEILWKKIFNENEAIVFFLNKERTISLAKITKVYNRWEAIVLVPPDKVENKPISSSWSLLDNSYIEDQSLVASVRWGYIYSPEVAKVYVGSYKKKNSFQEAKILEFNNYNIKLYYFLSDDKIGFKQNTVVAYNNLGDVLYSNRK